MSKPTVEQVQQEIAALKEIKPRVRRYTFFGDDNHDAIDAQIETLEQGYDEDDLDREWEEDEHIYQSAREALDWKNGYAETGLADSWSSLVVER